MLLSPRKCASSRSALCDYCYRNCTGLYRWSRVAHSVCLDPWFTSVGCERLLLDKAVENSANNIFTVCQSRNHLFTMNQPTVPNLFILLLLDSEQLGLHMVWGDGQLFLRCWRHRELLAICSLLQHTDCWTIPQNLLNEYVRVAIGSKIMAISLR